jgi:hypothetical protein
LVDRLAFAAVVSDVDSRAVSVRLEGGCWKIWEEEEKKKKVVIAED